MHTCIVTTHTTYTRHHTKYIRITTTHSPHTHACTYLTHIESTQHTCTHIYPVPNFTHAHITHSCTTYTHRHTPHTYHTHTHTHVHTPHTYHTHIHTHTHTHTHTRTPLQVNGTEVTGMSHTEVLQLLRSVSGTVELVVSRQETVEGLEEEEEGETPTSSDSTHPIASTASIGKTLISVEIPLSNNGPAGLGISVHGRSSSKSRGTGGSGIYIKSIMPGGATARVTEGNQGEGW